MVEDFWQAQRNRNRIGAWMLALCFALVPLASVGADPGPLDLNRASQEQLSGLPGIGPVRARAIVARRSEIPFERVEELLDVPGIGPAIFTGLQGRVDVVPEAESSGR